jgi:hypothetical protein
MSRQIHRRRRHRHHHPQLLLLLLLLCLCLLLMLMLLLWGHLMEVAMMEGRRGEKYSFVTPNVEVDGWRV